MQYIKINKLLKKPLYLQIADSIEDALIRGVLKHGDPLPSERLLCDAFDISPKVVAMLYQTLIERRLVIRITGKGTFISTRPVLNVPLKTFLHLECETHFQIQNVFTSKIKTPSSVLIDSDEVFVLYQVVFNDQHVSMFKKIYFDLSLEAMLWSFKEINTILEKVQFDTIHSKLVSMNVLDVEAAYLDIPRLSPCFLTSTYYQMDDHILFQEDTYFPGDYTKWEEQLDDISLL